jgi:hypothetical protein
MLRTLAMSEKFAALQAHLADHPEEASNLGSLNETALQWSCFHRGPPGLIRSLADTYPEATGVVSACGRSALHMACAGGGSGIADDTDEAVGVVAALAGHNFAMACLPSLEDGETPASALWQMYRRQRGEAIDGALEGLRPGPGPVGGAAKAGPQGYREGILRHLERRRRERAEQDQAEGLLSALRRNWSGTGTRREAAPPSNAHVANGVQVPSPPANEMPPPPEKEPDALGGDRKEEENGEGESELQQEQEQEQERQRQQEQEQEQQEQEQQQQQQQEQEQEQQQGQDASQSSRKRERAASPDHSTTSDPSPQTKVSRALSPTSLGKAIASIFPTIKLSQSQLQWLARLQRPAAAKVPPGEPVAARAAACPMLPHYSPPSQPKQLWKSTKKRTAASEFWAASDEKTRALCVHIEKMLVLLHASDYALYCHPGEFPVPLATSSPTGGHFVFHPPPGNTPERDGVAYTTYWNDQTFDPIAAAARVYNRLGEKGCPSDFFVLLLGLFLPDATSAAIEAAVSSKRLPSNLVDLMAERSREGFGPRFRDTVLHLALRSGRTWTSGISSILNAAPSSLAIRDEVTGLYPFQLAVCSSTLRERLAGNPLLVLHDTEKRLVPGAKSRTSPQEEDDVALDHLDTCFHLLRECPNLVLGRPKL